jgi:hypothetical protein
MSAIGKLQQVELRQLWKHEERGFSAWLAENLDVLGQAIGLGLSNPERETGAGDFAVDLVVESEQGERIIIENQLEATDHGHLGKVITYLTNLDAKAAIWIASRPRPEHIRAVQWLNETSPDDTAFYLVQLAAYRIADSEPAPLFTVIVGPSVESKDFGKQKKELAERHVSRLEFWDGLLTRAKALGVTTHAQRSPSKDHWLSAGAGVRSGVSYMYSVWTDSTGVELYIDTTDKAWNEHLFDQLLARRDEIEKAFGLPLIWERLDEKRASRIRFEIPGGGIRSPKEKWVAMQDAMIGSMDRLSRSLKPALAAAA